MTDVLWTRVSYAQHVRVVETLKSIPDAQAVHTAAVHQALKDVHNAEADIAQEFNEHAAERLRAYESDQEYRRPLPVGAGRGYYASEVWLPALPLVRWTAPKLPATESAALKKGRKLDGRQHVISNLYGPAVVTQIHFEEIEGDPHVQ
jgi:hypothetical protein